MTKHATRDGNWRIRYRDVRRRRTVYVTVVNGIIRDIQPELTNWFERPFRELCQWLKRRYPQTFSREHWYEQVGEPEQPSIHGEHNRLDDYQNGAFLPTPKQITEHCAEIQSRWSAGDERARRTGTSIKEAYTIPGASTEAFPGYDPHPVDGPLLLKISEIEEQSEPCPDSGGVSKP